MKVKFNTIPYTTSVIKITPIIHRDFEFRGEVFDPSQNRYITIYVSKEVKNEETKVYNDIFEHIGHIVKDESIIANKKKALISYVENELKNLASLNTNETITKVQARGILSSIRDSLLNL